MPDKIRFNDGTILPLKEIGNNAFENCSELNGNLTIGNNIETIDD
jgi:hypothetical protein